MSMLHPSAVAYPRYKRGRDDWPCCEISRHGMKIHTNHHTRRRQRETVTPSLPASLRRRAGGIPRQNGGDLCAFGRRQHPELGLGLDSVRGPPGAAWHRAPRLCLRHPPRGRRRPHRGNRQCRPQAHAGGKRPISAGFFFALGHSTIVILACIGIALTASALQGGSFKAVGSEIGTAVSAVFLLGIGLINILILKDVWRAFRRARHGGAEACAPDADILGGGLFSRLCGPLFRAISRSWHMYPLGALFGLGFDTATEIGVLSISAAEAAQGLSLWSRARVPRAVHGRDGARRYDRQRAHGRSLWLGVRAPGAQALVQSHHYGGVGRGGAVHRRHRGGGADRG